MPDTIDVTDVILPNLDGAVVECYRYPARVVPFDHRVDRSDVFTACVMHDRRPLEEELAEMAGVREDNHVVYGILFPNNRVQYVWFHDDYAYYGRQVDWIRQSF